MITGIETESFPRLAIGIVHGVEETYVVDWISEDEAYLVDQESGDVILEFASLRDGGFIHADDVLDQARDIVVDWDYEE